MEIEYPAFGRIVIDGREFDHDVIVDDGEVRARDKGPSRPLKKRYGHTPLSSGEDLPWSKPNLVIGSGYSGSLPVLPEIVEEAGERGVDLVVIPTAQAVDLLNESDLTRTNAVLHVTC